MTCSSCGTAGLDVCCPQAVFVMLLTQIHKQRDLKELTFMRAGIWGCCAGVSPGAAACVAALLAPACAMQRCSHAAGA